MCCSITHGAACPIDVVKTRIQLDPVTYNQGLIGGFRQVIAAEGAGALATGLVPTAGGYFVQGWFKFGGFEFFKVGTQPYAPAPPAPGENRTTLSWSWSGLPVTFMLARVRSLERVALA